MILNIAVVALMILISLLWGAQSKGRGLYSSLINFVCVLIAGAIAFGFWDIIVNSLLLPQMQDSPLLEGVAWGLGLIIPFVIAQLVLRVATDLILKSNMQFEPAINVVGGILFGACSAIITLGMLVTGLSFMRVGPELLRFDPLSDDSGNLVVAKSLWVPVDEITVGLYERLSIGGFATDTPLAVVRPDVHIQGATSRRSYDEPNTKSRGRVALPIDSATITTSYVVTQEGENSTELLLGADEDGQGAQDVQFLDGKKATNLYGSVYGYFVRFSSAANDESGKIIMGQGQARLICKNAAGDDAIGVHPFVFITQSGLDSPYNRFRVDGSNFFAQSVGDAAVVVMGFEFFVPEGYTPISLLLKNTRFELPQPATTFTSVADRDESLVEGELLALAGVEGASGSLGGTSIDAVITDVSSGDGNIETFNRFPNRWVLTKGQTSGLTTNDDAEITGGEGSFDRERLSSRGIQSNLRVESFASTRDTGIVMVKLADDGNFAPAGEAAIRVGRNRKPLLVDTDGRSYECVGYIFTDGPTAWFRFTPDRRLQTLAELPSGLSLSKRDQSCWLVFRPSKGAKIIEFRYNNETVLRATDPIEVER